MANNIIRRVWNQNRMVNIEDLTGAAFQAENGGHTFEISGIDDTGAAVALSGTVAGVFRRPDNADIALTGSASDGVVSVTLSEDCYAVPGRFGLTIFVTSNSQKVAVYACVGTVAVSSTGNVAGDTPANVEDLLDAIDAAIADLNSAIGQIPASYANVMAAIAPTYSGSALYSVGSYAWYDGTLYRCTTPITTAETWTAAHWTAAVLGDDVSDFKSTLTEKLSLKQSANLSHSDSDWTTGYYIDNRTGAKTASSSLSYSAKIPVNVGDVITLHDLYGGTFGVRQIRAIAAYDASGTFVPTTDALGWKVNSYTVASGVASIIISALSAANYMIVANATPTEFEPWYEPYYVATPDFIPDSAFSTHTLKSLKNQYAVALPKNKLRQTVGISESWYYNSMITPSTDLICVNGGYSSTEYSTDKVTFPNANAATSNNGFVWYAYDDLFNKIYNFDYGTGYGAPMVRKAENLSDCSLLAIGDSTIDQDYLTGTLLSYFGSKNKTITLLGTLGGTNPLNRNEGRAGWTTANYMADTTKNGYTNPFWDPLTEAFDFSYYMTQQGYSGVDFVVIQLGINDLYPSNPLLSAEPNYAAIWGNIKTMIDSILAYNSSTKIIINLPTTPNSDPSAHHIPLFLYQHYVIRYNDIALSGVSEYSDDTVRVSYCHLMLDPATDINDNVHPTQAGYEKMAMEVINQINCWQNGV